MARARTITIVIGTRLIASPPTLAFPFSFRWTNERRVDVVAQRLGGFGSVQIVQLEVGIAQEAPVSIEFDDFSKGQGSFELFVGA